MCTVALFLITPNWNRPRCRQLERGQSNCGPSSRGALLSNHRVPTADHAAAETNFRDLPLRQARLKGGHLLDVRETGSALRQSGVGAAGDWGRGQGRLSCTQGFFLGDEMF